jgi:type IV pilus assembly protein PilP
MKRLLFTMLLVAGLVGCNEELPPAPPPAPRQQEAMATRQDVSNQPVEKYSYSPIGKRDPFRPHYVDQALEEEAETRGRTLTELEKFEIDQLKLTGIVTGTSRPSALIEDPNGEGHTVVVGTLIGRHGGRVSKIKRDEVIITEEFRDPATNKKVTTPVTMRLPSDEFQLR